MMKIYNFIKYLLFFCFIKPFIYLVLGVNVTGIENLPKIKKGASIIVANHNSHIDTLLLMCLFPCADILKIHPVAAADYFCNTKFKTFVFTKLLGIIPIQRKVRKATEEEIFKDINNALRNGETIIIYPEGTRGETNELAKFKSGVAHIARMNPEIPVIPMFINGPDRILPKGDFLWVPFISDVYAGEPLYYDGTSTKDFTEKIRYAVGELKIEHRRKEEL